MGWVAGKLGMGAASHGGGRKPLTSSIVDSQPQASAAPRHKQEFIRIQCIRTRVGTWVSITCIYCILEKLDRKSWIAIMVLM